MMRLAAATLALVLAGVPLAMVPSPAIAIAGAAAGGLSLLGVVLRARPAAVAGVALPWIEYAMALSGSTGLDVASAVVIGTVSFLLLQTVDFAGRFGAIPVPRPAIVSQVGWWLGFCAAVAGLVIVATTVALVLVRPVPAPVAVAVALLSTAALAVGAARLARW